MEINSTPINPSASGERKVYSERAISFSALWGGPLAATYFLATNFQTIGKENEYKWTWVIGICITLIAVTILAIIPESISQKLPSQLFHFLWVIPAYLIFKKYQHSDIEKLNETGIKYGSWWKVIGYSTLALGITFIYGFVFLFIIEPDDLGAIPDFVRSEVKMEYSKCSIFYDSTTISQVDAKVVGSFLEEYGYFRPDRNTLNALVYREDNDVTILIAYPLNALNDSRLINEFKRILVKIETLYPDKSYRFRLVEATTQGELNQKIIE
jgi:hypothetical protein